jgi:hypothetical protein
MTRMRALTLAGLSTWLAVTPCRASPLTLDQSYVPSSVGHGLVIQNTQTVAQVFTVGRSGTLAAVDLLIGCCRFGPPPHDLVVDVRSTIGGVPSDTVLASVSVPSPGLAVDSLAFERLPLRGQHLRVRPGDVLSLVLSSVDPVLPGGGINPYAWVGEGFGGYAGGQTYVERGTGFPPTSWDMDSGPT